MSDKFPYTLSIAGFDPCGGAGVLADIKTFEYHKVQGFGILTANTFQNDTEFTDLNWIDNESITKQIDILFKKYSPDFVKIGIVRNLESITEIIDRLIWQNQNVKIIWDPVLKATAGKIFHDSIDFDLLKKILRNIFVLTPNLDEVKILFPQSSLTDSELQQSVIENEFNLLLKGGHSDKDEIIDKLFTGNQIYTFSGEKFSGYSKHGTGCVFSSALTANLAKKYSLNDACFNAKKYVEKLILSSETNLGIHFETD